MFKHKKDNYKIITHIKNLNKDFPNCGVKLAGKYLKIFTQSPDEHRIVTAYLKEKSEEFYVIDPPDSRPLKIVIKGLPVSTEIGEIQADLTSQGFCVEKVAQIENKIPAPHFYGRARSEPRLPRYLAVQKTEKGETVRNRNTITETNKPSKPVTPNLAFAAALSGAPNKNNIPGTSAAPEEALTTNGKNNENHFGFKDAISELRRFFLDYPFLLEMGRQFRFYDFLKLSENNGVSSPVTDGTPSRHLPSQRLVESSLAHRPLVGQVTPIDSRSHGDPDYLAIQYLLFLL
ncbi:hypothetical protein TNCV_4912091 [Trichonephila clavipes]|nr:hypothetical protein TNCV_4912091 [Trichonephila clavipes]